MLYFRAQKSIMDKSILWGNNQLFYEATIVSTLRIDKLYDVRRCYMGKILLKVWNIITTVLVVAVVVLALLLAGPRLVGMDVFTVLSGSMEPAYHTGSLIYVKDVDPFEIEPGQVITFMLSEDTVATHRVVGIVPDEDEPGTIRFRTKGDANNVEDGSLVHYKNIIGTPVFTIPQLGYLANYIQNPPGMYLAISAGAILLMMVFIPDLFIKEEEAPNPRRKKQKDKNNSEETE